MEETSDQELLLDVFVLVHELLYATSSINAFVLTSVERVRLGRDFQFEQWILFTVVPSDYVLGLDARASQECVTALKIFKNYVAINRVNAFSHGIAPYYFLLIIF
jgi:hypothetical protein